MTRTFADSFYFIALLNPADRFHADTLEFTGLMHPARRALKARCRGILADELPFT